MKTLFSATLGLVTLLAAGLVFSQAGTAPKDATFVSVAEQQQVAQAQKAARYDQLIKVVDAGKYNVAIAIIHHETPNTPGTHSGVTEVFVVTSGSGTLTTGGTIPDAKANNVACCGPGTGGAKIEGGTSRHMVTGDVAVVPPNVPHWWSDVTPPLNVLVIRPDTDRVLPAGYVNPALKQ